LKSLFYILFFTLLSFEGFSQINFPALSGRNGNLLPKLATTTAATSITTTLANSGGNVTSDGGASISTRGVVWSTSSSPTISSSLGITNDGLGIGSFTSSLTGLTTGTTYYVRAYATNIVGTGYGAQISFRTSSVPELTTTAVTDNRGNSAKSGATFTSNGGSNVTTRGVVWSTSSNPDISLSTKTTNETGTTNFTSNLTGLTPNTIYYLRAYATNSIGTGYGNEISFNSMNLLQIGDHFAGGIVGYILQSGDPGYDQNTQHGLIINDIPGSNYSLGLYKWDNHNPYKGFIWAANSQAIGSGLANTNAIISYQVDNSSAAGIARAYNGGGYTDWYLPSFEELMLIIQRSYSILSYNETTVAFVGVYWTSSEYGDGPTARVVPGPDGVGPNGGTGVDYGSSGFFNNKFNDYKVLATRTF